MEEPEEAVTSLNIHKSPGLRGLTAEFYKKTLELTKDDLLDIINCQMERVKIIDRLQGG